MVYYFILSLLLSDSVAHTNNTVRTNRSVAVYFFFVPCVLFLLLQLLLFLFQYLLSTSHFFIITLNLSFLHCFILPLIPPLPFLPHPCPPTPGSQQSTVQGTQ